MHPSQRRAARGPGSAVAGPRIESAEMGLTGKANAQGLGHQVGIDLKSTYFSDRAGAGKKVTAARGDHVHDETGLAG